MDELLRTAIWLAHKKRCVYSGERIPYGALQLDHILPRNGIRSAEELSKLRIRFDLPDDFNPDGPENLLPTLPRPNAQKSDDIDDLVTATALRRARNLLPKVNELYRKCQTEEAIALARAQLSLALSHEPDRFEDVMGLLDAIKSEVGMVELGRPIEFANGKEIHRLTRENAAGILDIPIAPRRHGLSVLKMERARNPNLAEDVRAWMLRDDHELDHEEMERWLEIVEKRDVYTAREWLEAVASGHGPANNYCIKESAFFRRVAVVSWAVGRWRTHDKSYLSDIGPETVELMSPMLLPHLFGNERDELAQLADSGMTMRDVLDAKGFVGTLRRGLVNLEVDQMQLVLWEIARGDFSGGGLEEILIQVYQRTLQGTYSDSWFCILSRDGDDSLIGFRILGDREIADELLEP